MNRRQPSNTGYVSQWSANRALMLETVTGPRDKQRAQQLLAGAAERLAAVVERRLECLPVIPAPPPLCGHSLHPSEAGRNGGSVQRAQSLKYFIEFVMEVFVLIFKAKTPLQLFYLAGAGVRPLLSRLSSSTQYFQKACVPPARNPLPVFAGVPAGR